MRHRAKCANRGHGIVIQLKIILIAIMALCVGAAGQPVGALTSEASSELFGGGSRASAHFAQRTQGGTNAYQEWYVNDEPVLSGPWRGGDPASDNKGYGPSRYFGDSNYAYASAAGGTNPAGSWARWEMGSRAGTQEIQVFVPGQHATARVRYKITYRASDGARTVEYSDWVSQSEINTEADNFTGWHSIGRNWNASGRAVTIEVHFDESRHAIGKTEPFWRGVAADAIAMRCIANCTSSPESTVPSQPLNLRLLSSPDGVLTITWDAPATTGGSRITGYRRVVSRPEGASRKSFVRTVDGTARSATFRTLRDCITYNVQIAAENSVGVGKFATAQIQFESSELPPVPENLTVRTIQGDDNLIKATWRIPPGSDLACISYEVRWSRDAIGNGSSWSSTGITSDTSRQLRGGTGRSYNVRVTALRNGQRSQPVYIRDNITLPRPEIINGIIGQEARRWILDDPDALVEWEPIDGVGNTYALDWRYMEIDKGRLREIYSQLKKEGVDSATRRRLENEADRLLDGTEIHASFIGGASTPNADPRTPEVYFWSDGRLVRFRTAAQGGSDLHDWDMNAYPISYRIHGRNDAYVLQARVKVIKSGWHGPWSDWAFHPHSKFSAGCRALDFYENIKTVLLAIDIAGWVVTAAGVVTAVVTVGTSTLAAQAVRTIAVQVARKIAKDLAIKNVMKQIAKIAINAATDSLRSNFLRFVFGCATHAFGDLEVGEAGKLGAAIIEESWDELSEATTWTNVEKNLLINALTD